MLFFFFVHLIQTYSFVLSNATFYMYFSFCIFSILADSRNQLCFVGSQWIGRDLHLYRTGIYGYGYIHGYPRKICGYRYGYGWEISYPRQPCKLLLLFLVSSFLSPVDNLADVEILWIGEFYVSETLYVSISLWLPILLRVLVCHGSSIGRVLFWWSSTSSH